MDKKNLKKIFQFLDNSEYSLERDIIDKHCTDWRGDFIGTSDIILFPKSISSISKIIKVCEKNHIPIIPQGGNTGLVGGSVPRKDKGEIVLNLKKMNNIRNINLTDNSVEIESGCILEDLKKKLEEHNMEFPLNMGSKGSCQVGGNIATNAGGVNYIKYGSIRQNILGLEVITKNGEIISNLSSIKKNNTGLDLKQIFIGSEGTLGIITAATFRIYKKPQERFILWLGSNLVSDILKTYSSFTKVFCDQISSFELMNKKSLLILKKIGFEFDIKKEYYCLIELSNFQDINNFQDYIMDKIVNLNLNLDDVILTKNEQENLKFWNIRESIPLAEKKERFVIKHDVSIPLEKMNQFINETDQKLKKNLSVEIINFGHIGDNNLHYNVSVLKNTEPNEKKEMLKKVNDIVYSNTTKFGGSISAEHGIGQLRKDDLKKYKSKFELEQMKSIKKIFDPFDIFNPGKIF
ncbi:MAG: hydroxyacid dehydrogenase [Rickettsiales bacterium]|nr:hydroxyacid dehydrogenase [Rickettsiales bacterium]